MDGKIKALAELFSECCHFFGLGARLTRHINGMAEDQFCDLVAMDELFQLSDVRAFVLPIQCFQWLGGDAEGVRDGEPDAAGADI